MQEHGAIPKAPLFMSMMESDMSRSFKINIQEIEAVFNSISGVTDKLETKVAFALRKHQQQFFHVYKQHMSRVKKEVEELQQKLLEKQNQAVDAQNNGTLAKMTRKIAELEKQLTRMYTRGEEKDRVITNLKIQLNIAKQEIDHFELKFKDGLRGGVQKRLSDLRLVKSGQSSINVSRNEDCQEDTSMFATQLRSKPTAKEARCQLLDNSVDKSKHQSRISIRPTQQSDQIRDRLALQVKKLAKTNQQLLKHNVMAMSLHSELEEFFVKCIQDTKKHVAIRHGDPSHKVTTNQFTKDDKMGILLLMLSNDQLISAVYNKIFNQNKSPQQSLLGVSQHPNTSRRQLSQHPDSSRRQSLGKEVSSGDKKSQRYHGISLQMKLPMLQNPGLKAQIVPRLAKRKSNFNYNDFL